jgi:small conductance mechanosensitive channel
LEDQYGVGDVVAFGTAPGTVEAVGLRVTRLRDVNGTVWYMRNGEISAVGNMSQNWARTVLDIPVAFSEDIGVVRALLEDVARDLWDDPEYRPDILEGPEVWGVERWDPDGVVLRVVLKTAPLQQWSVAREMRERIKARFDAEGIEIPLPQRMVWHRDAAG